MQTQKPAIKRRGNPNFGKPTISQEEQIAISQDEKLKKQYIFQLTKTHEKAKPRDSKSGELVGSAYQPFWAAVNSGVAWDADYISPTLAKKSKEEQNKNKGGQRRWRYLYNYPTIWVDEQIDPEPTKEELGDALNDLTFRQGILRVFGHEETKLQALMLNNGFAGCKRPLKNVPKDFVLLDQDKIDKEVLQHLDDSFNAEKSARDATLEEMYSVGYFFGIDAAKSETAFRKAFIDLARSKPAVFNREFVNPKNRYKYTFLSALEDNIISGNVIAGKLVYVETGAPLCDLKTADIAEELASNCMANVEKAVTLYDRLDKFYKEQENG